MSTRQALVAFIRIIALWILVDDGPYLFTHTIYWSLRTPDGINGLIVGDEPTPSIWPEFLREDGAYFGTALIRSGSAVVLFVWPAALVTRLAGKGAGCPRCRHPSSGAGAESRCPECGCNPGPTD